MLGEWTGSLTGGSGDTKLRCDSIQSHLGTYSKQGPLGLQGSLPTQLTKVAATSRLPLGLLLLGRAEERSQAAHRRPGASASRSPSRSCLCGDSRAPHCDRELINQEPGRQPLDLYWVSEGWSSSNGGLVGSRGLRQRRKVLELGERELSNIPIVSVPAKDGHTVGA